VSWIHTHTRPELEQEFADGWNGRHGKGAKARRRYLRRLQAEDRAAGLLQRLDQLPARQAEQVKQKAARDRKKHAKQRQWINQARGT